MIIDGKTMAQELKNTIKAKLSVYNDDTAVIKPTLAVVMVGDNQASTVYVRNKEKACEEIGIRCLTYKAPEHITQTQLLDIIHNLNQNEQVHGVFVQFPVPAHICKEVVQNAIAAEKDVDGFGRDSVIGSVVNGLCDDGTYFNACTPKGIIHMLDKLDIPKGSHAVIIGRSDIVGKPLSHLLLNKDYTVTVCHSKTKDLKQHTLKADVLISAVGIAKMVTADMVKPGAVVIDVGMNRDENNKLCGDVEFETVSKVAGHITPVPGGVGPMTVASLMENVFLSYRNHLTK